MDETRHAISRDRGLYLTMEWAIQCPRQLFAMECRPFSRREQVSGTWLFAPDARAQRADQQQREHDFYPGQPAFA